MFLKIISDKKCLIKTVSTLDFDLFQMQPALKIKRMNQKKENFI